jgi:hypothetical protein
MKGLDKFMGVGTILFFVEWNPHANPCMDVEYILHVAEKQANFT